MGIVRVGGASRGPWAGGKDPIGTEVIVRVGGTFWGPQAGGEAPVEVQGRDLNRAYSSGKGPQERPRHQLPGEAWGGLPPLRLLRVEAGAEGG